MMTEVSVIHVANISSLLILSIQQTTTINGAAVVSAGDGGGDGFGAGLSMVVEGDSDSGAREGSGSADSGTSSTLIISSASEDFGEQRVGGHEQNSVPIAAPELMESWAYVAAAVTLFFIGFFGFFLNLFVIALMCKDMQVGKIVRP